MARVLGGREVVINRIIGGLTISIARVRAI